MTIRRADEIIERLEILADDNYYPIEDNRDYKRMCFMIEKNKNNEDINNEEFMEYYRNILHDMKSYF